MTSLAISIEDQLYSSQYFWWIAYLRSSKDYWWICQQNGRCKDPRLVKVWKDFGNLFEEESLIGWWTRKSPQLFDTPQKDLAFEDIKYTGVKVVFTYDFRSAYPGMVCLAIPLNINPDDLPKIFKDFLKNLEKKSGKSPMGAPYKISEMKVTTLRKIVSAYQTMAMKVSLDEINKDHPSPWGYFEMGNHLEYSPLKNPDARLSPERLKKRRNSLCSMFCQRSDLAQDIISNVEVGQFPSTRPVPPLPRWTERQKAELEQAVENGQWQPSNWLRGEHAFLFKDSQAFAPKDLLGFQNHREQTLDAIKDYGKLFMPFLLTQRQRDREFKERGWVA